MSKAVVSISWSDVPHLTEKDKAELRASYRPEQVGARTKGIPGMGAGAIWPVQEEEVLCKPFAIPVYWPRAYALDVGWKRTAALWGAHDRETDTVYLYSEHYRGQAEPSVHAEAIRRRGEWIPGVIDPSARGRSQTDGQRLTDQYRDLGLDLHLAQNALEAGLDAVYERLSTGRMKIFYTLEHWRYEYRLYRRDEKGRIVKRDDHLMDCSRYLCLTGLGRARVKPPALRPRPVPSVADRTAGY